MLHISTLIAQTDERIRHLLAAIPMDELIAQNPGYKRYADDRFQSFVEVEKKRFVKAIHTITALKPSGTVVDLGCFIPYLPVALSLLGHKVKIVDNYKLYSPRFYAAIETLATTHGIELLDLDILKDDFSALGKSDVVLFMAVAEHLNGSPRVLLSKIHKILKPDGIMLFEVPNIAEFRRRLRFLFGRSPLAHYPDYFYSTYPFTGHNREMTVSEVRFLLNNSQFRTDRLECYDYSSAKPGSLLGWLAVLLKKVAPMRYKQEVIMAVATVENQAP